MNRLKKILVFLARPRFLLCFGLAWMLTNGWAYLFVLLGPALHQLSGPVIWHCSGFPLPRRRS